MDLLKHMKKTRLAPWWDMPVLPAYILSYGDYHFITFIHPTIQTKATCISLFLIKKHHLSEYLMYGYYWWFN